MPDDKVPPGEPWWVFDRPLVRDPLFLAALLLWLANAVAGAVWGDDHGIADRIGSVVLATFYLPTFIVVVGATAGRLRKRRRARAAR